MGEIDVNRTFVIAAAGLAMLLLATPLSASAHPRHSHRMHHRHRHLDMRHVEGRRTVRGGGSIKNQDPTAQAPMRH